MWKCICGGRSSCIVWKTESRKVRKQEKSPQVWNRLYCLPDLRTFLTFGLVLKLSQFPQRCINSSHMHALDDLVVIQHSYEFIHSHKVYLYFLIVIQFLFFDQF